MTAPTYTQQQTPHLFGQTPGYDPFNAFGTSPYGFNYGFGQQGIGQQGIGQQGIGQPGIGQPGIGQQWGPQQFGQPYQQGGDITTLVWQLLGYAQQSITLAQQIVLHTLQQQLPYQMSQHQWQNPFQPRGYQRLPMGW